MTKLAKNGRIKATVFRDKKKLDLDIPVPTEGSFVIPHLMDKYPRYFIYGPMVFMTASQELAGAMSRTGAASTPLVARQFDPPAFPGEEIVVLGARLLTHKTSKGYKPTPFSVVTRVNGTAVRNFVHLVELLRDAKGEFLTIDLYGYSSPLVFRRSEMAEATEEIPRRRGRAKAVLRRPRKGLAVGEEITGNRSCRPFGIGSHPPGRDGDSDPAPSDPTPTNHPSSACPACPRRLLFRFVTKKWPWGPLPTAFLAATGSVGGGAGMIY